MKRTTVEFAGGFRVLIGDEHSQAASIVIPSGDKEGGPDNAHAGADQWLYVQEGVGEAIVNGQKYPLAPGSLLLIQRGDKHEIRSTGDSALKTLNVYVPPAYTKARSCRQRRAKCKLRGGRGVPSTTFNA